VPFGNLLGHIVCREGVLVDPAKVFVILNMPPPTIAKQLWSTLGHTRYYAGLSEVASITALAGEVVEEI
jgi:hypothetical protein